MEMELPAEHEWMGMRGREGKVPRVGVGQSKKENEVKMCVLGQGEEMMKAMLQEIQSEDNMQNVLVGRE